MSIALQPAGCFLGNIQGDNGEQWTNDDYFKLLPLTVKSYTIPTDRQIKPN